MACENRRAAVGAVRFFSAQRHVHGSQVIPRVGEKEPPVLLRSHEKGAYSKFPGYFTIAPVFRASKWLWLSVACASLLRLLVVLFRGKREGLTSSLKEPYPRRAAGPLSLCLSRWSCCLASERKPAYRVRVFYETGLAFFVVQQRDRVFPPFLAAGVFFPFF